MLPAHQGLHTHHRVAVDINLGLIMQHHLAFAIARRNSPFSVIDSDLCLRPFPGLVDHDTQFLCRFASYMAASLWVISSSSSSPCCGYIAIPRLAPTSISRPSISQRLFYRFQYTLRDMHGTLQVRHIRQQDRKFVAAHARHGIGIAQNFVAGMWRRAAAPGRRRGDPACR